MDIRARENMKIILVFLFLAAPGLAHAIDAYKCTVLDASGLNDDGRLGSTSFTGWYLDKEFVVDKGTGRVKGGLSNNNGYGQPQVLDYGSVSQAFKALTIFKPFITVNYLYIEEFHDGNEKPFMFIDGNQVFSGKCVAY